MNRPTSQRNEGNVVPQLLLMAVILGGIVALFAYAGGWLTPHELTPARLTDTFEQLSGVHPGFRRNHAKGVCVSGYFESNGKGAELSRASVFQAGRVPVVGRFSLGGGQPDMADGPQAVRGLGLMFELPGGEQWRTAMVNLPVFPVRTPQAFRDFLLATAKDPATGKPNPAKMQAFLTQYPGTAKALQILGSHPPSSGFDDSSFNSLNAFRFVNSSGAEAYARWTFVPLPATHTVNTINPGSTNNDYLFDALITSVHLHPLQWRLVLTVAQAGDATDDASIPWPADRRQIDAGTLTLDHIESDDTGLARDLNFDPLVLPDGIATSDDPLLSARSAVYSQSFTRRESEPRTPSPISPAEVGRQP